MPLSANDISEIRDLLTEIRVGREAVARLRERFPALSFIKCDASDVTQPPFAELDNFDLHLLDASEHCIVLTSDLAKATGLVLAQKAAAS